MKSFDDFIKRPEVFGSIIIALGLFLLVGAWFSWEWFYTNPRFKRYEEQFGRKNIRIGIGLFGALFTLFGITIATGIIARR